MKKQQILVINLGGTSSKVAVFSDRRLLFAETIRHTADSLKKFHDFWDQYDFRRECIVGLLLQKGFSLSTLTCIVSRGAPVKPIAGGVYYISLEMVQDARSQLYGNHPTSVGTAIAFDLANELHVPALTVDPPCIDELIYQARYTGIPGMERKSWYQALNQKAIGRKLAQELGKEYRELKAVIAHIGSGLSIAAHCEGRVIDVNNGLDGDGPLAMERAGTLPAGALVNLCFHGGKSYEDIYNMINGQGGVYAHLGTKDGQEIEKRIAQGDQRAKEVFDTMAYRIAQSIGSCAVSLKGEVDAIALTGGLAYSDYLTSEILKWCGFLAKTYIFAGEDEMISLLEGAMRALQGREPIKTYPSFSC